jgi:small-conductance mechanosensitive channel
MSVKIVGQTKVHKKRAVAGELRMRLKIAFDNEKIEMPYPQMVLHQVDNALQELPNTDKTQKETPKMDNPKDPNYSTEVKIHAQKPSL